MMSTSSEHVPEHCRSLFLGDLSCFCQEIDIYRVFQQYGPVEDVRIKRNKEGTGLGYGFITFHDPQSAITAMAAGGTVILGRPVKVSWATERNSHHPSSFSIPTSKTRQTEEIVSTAQLHFSFISKQRQRLVTEATIRDVFNHFGEVVDVTIKKTKNDHKTGEQTGYGFLHYPLTEEGIQSAVKAAGIVKQVHINHVLYDCRVTWSLEEILNQRNGSVMTAPVSPVSPHQGYPAMNAIPPALVPASNPYLPSNRPTVDYGNRYPPLPPHQSHHHRIPPTTYTSTGAYYSTQLSRSSQGSSYDSFQSSGFSDRNSFTSYSAPPTTYYSSIPNPRVLEHNFVSPLASELSEYYSVSGKTDSQSFDELIPSHSESNQLFPSSQH